MRFNELSEDVKKEVIKNTLASDWFMDNVAEDLDDHMREEFAKETFDIDGLTLRYSLGHNQGDGVSFVGSINGDNLEKLPFMHMINDIDSISIMFTPNSLANHYAHVNTVDVFIDYDGGYGEEDYTREERRQFENAVKSWYRGVCDRLEKSGYDYLDMCETDDYVESWISYDEFDENGRMIA